MNTVHIKSTNITEILKTVADVEGKATMRCIDATAIPSWIKRAEAKLHALDIPKKVWVGCKIRHYPESVSKSYGSVAYGTFLTLERGQRDWFVVEIVRGRVSACAFGGSAYERLILTDDAKKNIATTQTM